MSNTAIHYEGFTVVAANRLYSFSVNDASDGPRKFTVEIQPSSFLSSQLKFQDGPAISLLRLKREIELESPTSPAKAHLTISVQDIEAYMTINSPKKAARRVPQHTAVAAD